MLHFLIYIKQFQSERTVFYLILKERGRMLTFRNIQLSFHETDFKILNKCSSSLNSDPNSSHCVSQSQIYVNDL
jgi:hypothetical protein